MAEQEGSQSCKCARCSLEMPTEELEAHISSEHIEYFPYSCGHCGHFFTTDVLAHFHAKIKDHLPIKIREQPNIAKFQELRQVMTESLKDADRADVTLRGTRPPSPVNSLASGSSEKSRSLARPLLRASETPITKEDTSFRTVRVSPQWTVQALMQGGQSTSSKASDKRTGSSAKRKRKSKPTAAGTGEEMQCCRCGVLVAEEDHKAHILTHRSSAAIFSCHFCSYVANSAMSVCRHIQMKHKHCKPATKGVKRMEEENADMSDEDLFQLCFSSQATPAGQSSDEPLKKVPREGGDADECEGVGMEPLYTRQVTLPNGKVYQMMECHKCGEEVCEAEASIHIYRKHICWDNLIQCNYCEFKSSYDWVAVKEHLVEAHPNQRLAIRDRRCTAKAGMLVKQWVRLCFTDKVDSFLKNAKQKADQKRRQKSKKTPKPVGAESEVTHMEQHLCHLCNCWINSNEVDSHVWRTHSSDNLPYKCGSCVEGSESLNGLEMHWRSAHGTAGTMEVVPNDGARAHFEDLMVICFPEEAGVRWASIKLEPQYDWE